MRSLLSILFYGFFLIGCTSQQTQIASQNGRIIPGAENTIAYSELLASHRIAVIVNNTSRIGEHHLVDSLLNSGIHIHKIFTPEHGYKGTADAGAKIEDDRLKSSDIPIVSLYGKKKKPSVEDLQGIELAVFDIQDVGVRFYTYISTLHYVMEACAENNIPLIVLDRPNPLASYIDGPILKKENQSFVGMHPVPIVYGMTIGEYAQMINGEGWLDKGIKCDLSVIPISNYKHNKSYILPVKPSPNLPNNIAIGHYPSLCFFEGTTVSIGRGTDKPFQVVGHPETTNKSFTFTPQPMTGASSPKHKGTKCYGIDLSATAPSKDGLDLSYLIDFHKSVSGSGTEFFLETNFFDLLAGNNTLREQIKNGKTEAQIRETWTEGLNEFKATREKYLIYE